MSGDPIRPLAEARRLLAESRDGFEQLREELALLRKDVDAQAQNAAEASAPNHPTDTSSSEQGASL